MPKDGAMPYTDAPAKRYRLGNQNKQYELITTYVGWSPEGFDNWSNFARNTLFRLSTEGPQYVAIVSPDGKERVELIMDHAVAKVAFPPEFYREAYVKDWWRFYLVSLKERPDAQFIIPLH